MTFNPSSSISQTSSLLFDTRKVSVSYILLFDSLFPRHSDGYNLSLSLSLIFLSEFSSSPTHSFTSVPSNSPFSCLSREIKVITKPASRDVTDFEVISGHDDQLPQPAKGKMGTLYTQRGTLYTRRGTLYIEAQVKPDYSGSVAKVCNHLCSRYSFEHNTSEAYDQD